MNEVAPPPALRASTRRAFLAGSTAVGAGLLLCSAGLPAAQGQVLAGRDLRAADLPRLGRFAGCTILPRRDAPAGRRVFRVNGTYTHPVTLAPITVRNVDIAVDEGTAAILGDGEGRLVASPEAEVAGCTRLCTVRVRPGSTVAHHSFIALEPPVDDPAAMARKAAYDAWPLPRRSNAPGPRLTALADATTRAEWDAKTKMLRLNASVALSGLSLRSGSVILARGNTYKLADVSVDAPAVDGSHGIAVWPHVEPKSLELEFFDIRCSAAGPRVGYGGGAGVVCQNVALRHGTISDFQHGIGFPGNGVYEFLLIKDCGKPAGAHGNGFFCVYPDGTDSIGDFTARLVNVDMPSPSSPDWIGNTMTACVSMFNTMGGKPTRGVRNITFDQCRFNGGSRAVTLYSRNGNAKISDISFTNCAFGRHFEFQALGPVLLDGPKIENAKFENCFWEDSGELITALNGVWDTTSGQPVRRSV